MNKTHQDESVDSKKIVQDIKKALRLKHCVNEGVEMLENGYEQLMPSFTKIFPQDNQLENKVWL